MKIRAIALAFCLTFLATAHAAEAKGRFVGSIVTKWLTQSRHMILVEPVSYFDSSGKEWPVPAGVMIDGASIPPFWWTLIGGPYEGRYRDASVIHDYYCDTRGEAHKAVHRMFYDAMLTSGVSKFKADLLYAAVLIGGPKWDEQAVHNARIKSRLPVKELMRNCITSVNGPVCDIVKPADYDTNRADYEGFVLRNPTSAEILATVESQSGSTELTLDRIDEIVATEKQRTIRIAGDQKLLIQELDKFDIDKIEFYQVNVPRKEICTSTNCPA